MADRTVTVIQPRLLLPSLSQESGKQRVATYARVSTDSDEQMGSVEAQKDYFEKLIMKRPDWEFAGIYADEGISGTSLNRREAFNRMVADALDGKIDLIITKSLSRFARNTVDTLNTIRKLKIAGVGVYFEKEDINTLDSKGEFLITLMSSLAEEESRSISENVKWGQRKRFADGKYSLPYKQFLGYKKGANGAPELVEEEAKIIRLIYRLFLQGYATAAIANILTNAGIPTPAKCSVWQRCTIVSILSNEKYYGAALMQKKFTVDFLQKKMKVNEGEVPQYYVEHSHEAIIAPAEWERVQAELARRKSSTKRTISSSPFSCKIICGDCGETFTPKVWHSTSKYRRTIWRCRAKYEKGEHCTTPHIYESDLKQHFITALSQLLTDRTVLLEDGRLIQQDLLNFDTIDTECNAILQELDVVTGMIQQMVKENAAQAANQIDYTNRYNALVDRYETLQLRYDSLQAQRQRKQLQAAAMDDCLTAIEEVDLLQIQFSDVLWNTVVDHVTVCADKQLVFHFKNGADISIQM